MMSKIYAALVSTFTASEIYAQDSVQGVTKGDGRKCRQHKNRQKR